jgi:YD repeat-containing protein
VDGPLSAWPTHIASTRDRLKLSSGQTRWTSTQTTYDDLNYPTQVNDQGDEASTDDDRCSTLEYARNPGANILGTVKRTLTVSLKCGTAHTSGDVLADTRTYFDDPDTYGKTPTRGLPVRVDELDSWTGSDPQFVTTQKTVYDDLGRPSSVADALGHTTRTAFTPATSGPVTKAVVTDPLGRTVTTMLDRNLGVPLTTSDDANSAVTQMKYDGDGRLLAYWAPGRSSTANPDEPNATYTYQLRNGNAPTAVTTKTLTGYASKTYRTSIALYDGLLRKRQTQTQTVNGGRAILDTLYDSRGLVAATSNPYPAPSWSPGPAARKSRRRRRTSTTGRAGSPTPSSR